MKNILRISACILTGFLLSTNSARAKSADTAIFFPDVNISGYSLSGISVSPTVPAMDCTITPPPATSANVLLTVFFYDSADPHALPYGHATNAVQINNGNKAICGVSNGQQPVSSNGTVKRISIQLSAVSPTVSGSVDAIPK